MPTKTKEINEEKVKPAKKVTAKKGTVKKEEKKATKKASTSTSATKATTKKSTATKTTAKKASTTKKTTTKKASTIKTVAKKATTRKIATKKEKTIAEVVEYYDLPYRYNETIVKILYQTPDTLFVYWDISDKDRENYIAEYGENFFNITRPVLIVHNDTMNYSFEIPINDFANSWYLHINDSKCNYRVELGRRPNYYNEEATKEIQENIHTDYIYVSDSNKIESPNDRVLFSTNENNTIKFRNVKNQHETSKSLYEIVKNLPAMRKVENIPYIKEELFEKLYTGLYESEDISLFERISNPTSAGGNPSSGSIPVKF